MARPALQQNCGEVEKGAGLSDKKTVSAAASLAKHYTQHRPMLDDAASSFLFPLIAKLNSKRA